MPRNILLVHTNEALGRFLTVLLQQDGHRIVPAGSVKEVLRAVQTTAPHVVIIEDGCPDISTVDLVQRLQRGEENVQLPIIVISADPAMEYELHHVFDFLLKPVDVNRLRQDLALLARGGRKRVPPARLGHLTEEESRLYCDYLLTHSGLHFERRNLKLLERGITSRMAALHSASYRDYFDYLTEYRESRQELQKLLQHLTVGETYFFRYRAHFDAL
ncbi:MAG TPA: response regulator, partial [Syntrophobacteria bacterium]|nr:response regulator [Syntrophobacteria bacterium]